MTYNRGKMHIALAGVAVVAAGIFISTSLFDVNAVSYEKDTTYQQDEPVEEVIVSESEPEPKPESEIFTATHVDTPEHVRALYMSSWVASSQRLRNKSVELIEDTELNALVIDIKDSTGKISFLVDNELINNYGAAENRIRDVREFIAQLHEKNIYVIGRISVFQDPYLAVEHPDMAVRRVSDDGVWKDHKGLSFLDPNNTDVWDYTVAIAKESYRAGFDEINFDYIRFPSDGDISDINYGLADGNTRAASIEKFFAHLRSELHNDEVQIPMSADLFGMVTSNNDDLGIGQVLERALPYFDYIGPMIYPSHYPKGWHGLSNPAANPYEVVSQAMKDGIAKQSAAGFDVSVWRPWIQDFDLGANYTAEKVQDQIRALAELGIYSWMVWDPANTYTRPAYEQLDSMLE